MLLWPLMASKKLELSVEGATVEGLRIPSFFLHLQEEQSHADILVKVRETDFGPLKVHGLYNNKSVGLERWLSS